MNDTINYGLYNSFRSNEKEYKPFEQNEYNKKDKDNHKNFCPVCHYNYNSHYHKKHCSNTGIPIGNGVLTMMILISFYVIYRSLKNSKMQWWLQRKIIKLFNHF